MHFKKFLKECEKLIVPVAVMCGSLVGCNCNPVAPANYKDATKFAWTVDTIAYSGSFQTAMTSIWTSSANNVYIVGANSADAGLMYHFDGKSWSRIPITVNEGGPIQGSLDLSGIYGFNTNDIWVIGDRIDSLNQITLMPYFSPLIIHWNGQAWTEDKVSGKGVLASIHGLSPNDVWAVGGGNMVFHFDGSSWKKSDIPVPPQGMSFGSVADVAPSNVYTIGFINDITPPADTGSYFLYRFNGASWNVIDSVVITSSYVGPIKFGQKLFSINGVLYTSFGNGVQVYAAESWNSISGNTNIAYLGGNDVNNLFGLGANGTVNWYNGKSWTQLNIPFSSGVTLSSVWSNGQEVFIVGYDIGGHNSYIIQGR